MLGEVVLVNSDERTEDTTCGGSDDSSSLLIIVYRLLKLGMLFRRCSGVSCDVDFGRRRTKPDEVEVEEATDALRESLAVALGGGSGKRTLRWLGLVVIGLNNVSALSS